MKKLAILIAFVALLIPFGAQASNVDDREDIQFVAVDSTMSCDETRDGGKETKPKDYAVVQIRDKNGNVCHDFDGQYIRVGTMSIGKVDNFQPNIDLSGYGLFKIENGEAKIWFSSDREANLKIWDFYIYYDKGHMAQFIPNCNVELQIRKVTVPVYLEINNSTEPTTVDVSDEASVFVHILNTADNAIPYLGGTLTIGKIISSNPDANITINGKPVNGSSITGDVAGQSGGTSFFIDADQPTTVTLSDFSMELWQVGNRKLEFINGNDDFNFRFNGPEIRVRIETTYYSYSPEAGLQTVYAGDTVTLPDFPDWIDFTLTGWTDGTHTYAPGETVTIEKETTFTAIWESTLKEAYTIKYNSSRGAWPAQQMEFDGTVIQLPILRDVDGYIFKGWSDGSQTYAVGVPYTVTKNVTMTAVWEKAEQPEEQMVDISFNTNGRGSTPATQTVTMNTSIYLPNLGSDGEYEFIGWWDGNVFYAPGDRYIATRNTTLYANWERIDQHYVVKFTNTGELEAPSDIDIVSGDTVQLPDLGDREEYEFVGWSDGFSEYAPGSSVTIKRNTTFIAQWKFKEATRPSNILMFIQENFMNVDGNSVALDAVPYIKQNRTYVPIRALSEAFGAKVDWDGATRSVTITLDECSIVMDVGSIQYFIDGVPHYMDVAPEIEATTGRTFVPVRFVAEGLGFGVYPSYNIDGTTASVLFSY